MNNNKENSPNYKILCTILVPVIMFYFSLKKKKPKQDLDYS